MPPRDNGHEEPVIRDKRKIDPETGQVRGASATQEAPAPKAEEAPVDGDLLAERTADLQRLQAEYTNYRRRVERDRISMREQAVAGTLAELLPVLDDIGRARDHGELTGGFAKVAESLEAVVTKLGLTSFGQKGDPFDPTVHEALMHSYSPDVNEPTAIEVLQPGYRIGDRVLRPARVAVAEPSEPAEEPDADASPASADDDEN